MSIDPAAPFPLLWLQCLVVVTVVSLASTAAGALLERAFSDRTRVFALEIPEGQLAFERRRYALFVLLCTTAGAVWLSRGWIRLGSNAPLDVALTFGLVWTAFEVYYYGLHRLLHTRALYRFHAPHHESRITTVWTGQSLSLVEATGWIAGLVVLPSLLGLVVPMSPVGLAIYFVANTFVNVAGHANVELNPVSARAFTWLNHPWIYHALHHARFKGNYSFASTFMDRLFGTEWDDWQRLHARVVAGDPLRSFNDRGEDPTGLPSPR